MGDKIIYRLDDEISFRKCSLFDECNTHLTSSGWNKVNYPHIATSAAYGHWVCVVGIRPDADPANLKESDFYALDPARVSANGTLAVTRLLDGTIWTDNSPLKTAG